MLTDLIAGLASAHDIPEPPPADPLPLLLRWYDEARASNAYADFNAMTLATCTRAGAPSARVVLCKAIEPARCALLFFTNYDSRKARDLADNPRAAAVFHWPHAKRQARVEGVVERTTPDESDAYFRSRPLLSRLGARASPQSRAVASRADLVRAVLREAATAATAAGDVERPANWGGYRLIATSVELWSGRDGRLHQRCLWTRDEPTARARGVDESVHTPDILPWQIQLLAP